MGYTANQLEVYVRSSPARHVDAGEIDVCIPFYIQKD